MREIQIGTNIRVCDCQFICFLNKHIQKTTRGLEIFKITFKFRFDCCKIIIKIIVCFVVTRLNDLYYWEILKSFKRFNYLIMVVEKLFYSICNWLRKISFKLSVHMEYL
jgi:hypothetical protein